MLYNITKWWKYNNTSTWPNFIAEYEPIEHLGQVLNLLNITLDRMWSYSINYYGKTLLASRLYIF